MHHARFLLEGIWSHSLVMRNPVGGCARKMLKHSSDPALAAPGLAGMSSPTLLCSCHIFQSLVSTRYLVPAGNDKMLPRGFPEALLPANKWTLHKDLGSSLSMSHLSFPASDRQLLLANISHQSACLPPPSATAEEVFSGDCKPRPSQEPASQR